MGHTAPHHSRHIACRSCREQTLFKMVHQVVDKEDFAKQRDLAGGKLIVIDFFAVWCGPCKMIAPKLEEMSKSMDDVVFLKVDVDECEDLAAEFQISAMPTFVFWKNKQRVDTVTGANEPK